MGSALKRFTPILLLIPILSSCGDPYAQRILGTWAVKEKPGETWQFTKNGDVWFHSPRPSSNIYLDQEGTYTFDGYSLFLNMSGKNVASSRDPSERLTVDTINGQPARPSQTTWTTTHKTTAEYIVTTHQSGETITYTLDWQR